MEIIKKSLPALVLLLVVVLVWVGFYIYFKSTEVVISSEVQQHTTQLGSSFDLEVLEEVAERTEKNFPVSPEVFLSLVERD